ncbi:LacI family DNA-binding transcriptional regulator [Microbacterium sp.]|uniref:LacI family DNA-binding transcriptional regulator n=1 Tax=Microbacterium sp. TaxID=51671 RepID=UPI0039E21728
MADVAAAAGVSGQTVSRVVNGSPRVDPATRAKVEAAMAALGYRMHRAARALRTGRTDTIGVIVSTLASVGNSRMLEAIADAAAQRGFALALVTVPAPDGAAGIAGGFARLHDEGVDGAIVLNEATALARDAAVPPGLALVVVDSPADDRYIVVQTDHAAGARAAVAHLIAAGHRNVWHLAGPDGSYAAAERERAWRETMDAAGIAAPPVLRGDWTAASGFRAAAALPPEATALFVANDQMALGALRALADAGRSVPADVAVVGFDDVDDAAQYQPPLTTVRQDFDALGAAAVTALIAAIEGRHPSGTLLAPRLVVRASA